MIKSMQNSKGHYNKEKIQPNLNELSHNCYKNIFIFLNSTN